MLGVTGFALTQRFADAQNRYQPGLLRAQKLAGDQIIVLAKVLATLRVTNDHVATAHIHQHFR